MASELQPEASMLVVSHTKSLAVSVQKLGHKIVGLMYNSLKQVV